ncbi:amino acid decarboxylase [Candidatus Enterococcus leclercqii]|uniref:prenylated flavin chaperone LpdD n=1 Tax=Candidatus Enterococcus leclercqii TaxID=1857218 RepID=UPI001F23242C|nr:amino acid decarboxylase [Enterococcus sp. CU9D]
MTFLRKEFMTTQAEYTMEAEVTIINEDLVVLLTGGDVPHVGTVTETLAEGVQVSISATNFESEFYASKKTATDYGTLRFPSHSGRFHKDDVLAESFLKALSLAPEKKAVVIAGVHVDGITKEQIAVSYQMAAALGTQAKNWLTTVAPETRAPRYYD